MLEYVSFENDIGIQGNKEMGIKFLRDMLMRIYICKKNDYRFIENISSRFKSQHKKQMYLVYIDL